MKATNLKDSLNLYLNFTSEEKSSWINKNLDGFIPNSLSESIKLANQKRNQINSCTNNDLEMIGKIIQKTNRKYNLFTQKAKSNLEIFYNSGYGVEIAHQPKFLGGERFLLNKIACGSVIANKDINAFPFFYLADYDKVHPELIKTNFPVSNSSKGFKLSISKSLEKKFNQTRIKNLPLLSNHDLNELINTIKQNYQFSIKNCVNDKSLQKLYEERLESALYFIRRSWHLSETYSDWFLNIIGEITNNVSDQGILFLTACDTDYRKILIPAFEDLTKYREKYIQIYQILREQFISHGYEPPLRKIDKKFVPFFYECQEKTCHFQRITLFAENKNNKLVLLGKCQKCKQLIEIECNINAPDLSDHALNFTPRVESRQYIVSKSTPIGLHVAGTGETRYYTMSLPLINQLNSNVTLPVIYFYNKTIMNSIITRNNEKSIINLNIIDFLNKLKMLMKKVGIVKKQFKKEEDLQQDEQKYSEVIKTINEINQDIKKLENDCMNYINQHPNSKESKLLSYYLSNMFGKIAIEKSGQEAVFNWLDLCINNGFLQLFTPYYQLYTNWQIPGHTIII